MYVLQNYKFLFTPCPPLTTEVREEATHCLCQVVLPAVPSHTYTSTRMTCPQVGRWQDECRWQESHLGSTNRSPPPPPLPARKVAIPLKTTHSSKEQRRIGARASKATYSQDTWLSHEVHVVEEVGATFPTLPSPLPAHPPAPDLKEMGGWQSHKALSP